MIPLNTIIPGDCLQIMRFMPAECIDSVITDPPYGLEFMGKNWDRGVPGVEFWAEAFRVTKPGGYILAFGGTRTWHRLACAIEDAGWEIRDCLLWLYGTGFPKGLDISAGIDAALGADRDPAAGSREWTGGARGGGIKGTVKGTETRQITTAAATEEAAAFDGYKTGLKPAWEPIILGLKPPAGGFAENALKHGLAGLNIGGCRIPAEKATGGGGNGSRGYAGGLESCEEGGRPVDGRFPTNVILDPEAAGLVDAASGVSVSKVQEYKGGTGNSCGYSKKAGGIRGHNDSGGASRFFYCAKASQSERDGSTHPTMKPLDLMRYLCRLTKPPGGGVVLDPFSGSGTTLLAARETGRDFVGIELSPEYVDIIRKRLAASWQPEIF